MRLYVANCTKHRQKIYYRLDFNQEGQPATQVGKLPKSQDVEPGRQIVLGGDLHKSQIVSIVDQIAVFGAAGTVDVPRLKYQAPYVFDIDKAVPADTIRKVMAHNGQILIHAGRARREKAAIVVNKLVEQRVAEELIAKHIEPPEMKSVDVEFEQEEQSEQGEKTIAEGYTMGPNVNREQTSTSKKNAARDARRAASRLQKN